jgi:uncharacterized cupredoxin-like copper-binding protein
MRYRVLFTLVLFTALLGLAGCSGVNSTTTAAQVVHVTLSDGKIMADQSTFSAGTPYHFVVTNTGRVAHQFMMVPMGDWNYNQMSMQERHQHALYMYDQINPGETKTFDYTFPVSAVGQHYGFACYQEGCCGEGGMWADFTVQQHP